MKPIKPLNLSDKEVRKSFHNALDALSKSEFNGTDGNEQMLNKLLVFQKEMEISITNINKLSEASVQLSNTNFAENYAKGLIKLPNSLQEQVDDLITCNMCNGEKCVVDGVERTYIDENKTEFRYVIPEQVPCPECRSTGFVNKIKNKFYSNGIEDEKKE